jgi:hypothetical protein
MVNEIIGHGGAQANAIAGSTIRHNISLSLAAEVVRESHIGEMDITSY